MARWWQGYTINTNFQEHTTYIEKKKKTEGAIHLLKELDFWLKACPVRVRTARRGTGFEFLSLCGRNCLENNPQDLQVYLCGSYIKIWDTSVLKINYEGRTESHEQQFFVK